MARNVYFARVPLRNAYLGLRNWISSGNAHTDLLRRYGVDLVLDVGANKGQYGRYLKKYGYSGSIVSFEPLPDAFEKLSMNRWGFSNWSVEPMALGSEDTTATLNVAGNSQSSSLQPMHANHVAAAPASAYIGNCEVTVRRLDSVFAKYHRPGQRCYLKMDVQGHEQQVLAGATETLPHVVAIEAELSMVTLYEGQQLWQETIASLQQLGFELAQISPVFFDPQTGMMLQADGIFVRRSEAQRLRAAA